MLEESLLKTNFIGRDGFRWWVGQVAPESAQGQQINGAGWGNRYKVRIMGYHPYTETDLKNDDLPWAQVILPTTAGSGAANQATSVKISPGDSVFGFFLDGDNAQLPVILGVFGRTSEVSSKPYQIPFLPHTGQTSRTSHDGKNLNKGEANESNTKSQKSPRHVPVPLASKIDKSEISFFTGIGDKIYFATQSPSSVVGKLTVEVDNFINAVQSGIKKATDLINVVTDKIQSIATGLIGSMLNSVYQKLIPLLNQGLKLLYQTVYAAVLAATGSTTAAHLAGVAAQTAMVPPINAIQKILPCLANTIINSLSGIIKDLLNSVIKHMKRLSSCASNQFVGSLINDIIEKIDSGLSGVLGGVSNLIGLIGGFNPASFLRGTANAIAGIAGLLSCKQSANDYNKPTNVWTIGKGAKDSSGISYKDILKSANEAEALFKSAARSVDQTKSKAKYATKQITDAFESFSQLSKSSKSKCYTGPELKCGEPQVKIFGGGGKDAEATPLIGAIVGEGRNKTGSVVGIKVKKKGKKYRFPPFVEITDECGQGYGAVARSVINENGEIEYIYMVSDGENYPIGENIPPYYVDSVQVIDSGSDYNPNDYGVDQFGNTYSIQVNNGFIEKVTPNSSENIIDPVLPNEDSINGGLEISNLPDKTQINEIIRGEPRTVKEIIKQPIVDDLPVITIISETGFGAVLNPTLDIVPNSQFSQQTTTSIDCVE